MSPDKQLKQIRGELLLSPAYTRRRNSVLRSISILFMMLLVGAVTFYWWGLRGAPESVEAIAQAPDQRRINVLLVGSDKRGGDAGRSDTIMVVSFDPLSTAVGVLSIPRDTRVKLPQRDGHDKINTAFSLGGVRLVSEAVATLLDLRIDHYVALDFSAFERVVDALGGVELDVPVRMQYVDKAQSLEIDIEAGKQRLDGETALHFVRYRSDGLGDVSLVDPANDVYAGRVERQLQFVRALVGEMLRPVNILRAPIIVPQVIQAINTDFSLTDMLSLANAARHVDTKNVKSFVLPGKAERIGGVSYWVTDEESARRVVRSLVSVGKEWNDVAVLLNENRNATVNW